MYEKPLPYGEPIFYNGKYIEDKIYNLYIQMITCRFKIKKNKIPTIQIKNSMSYRGNEYLEESGNELECLVLTSVDLKLFLEQYDVFELEFICGWKFKSVVGIFKDYIDKWIKVKIESTINGNKAKRTLAKLMLNSLYGKLSTSLEAQSKIPYLGDDNIVHYKLDEKRKKKGFYLPAGAFITAYAREKTIRTSQAIKDYSIKKYGKDLYCYSDTDSIHCLLSIEELRKFCDIDPVRLGAWKHESTFRKAKFIRQKCYLEMIKREIKKISKKFKKHYKSKIYKNLCYKRKDFMKITCAGLPKECYSQVEWDKFKEGFTCSGKLTFKHVVGGVKLVETDFTIKEEKLLKNIDKF